MRLTRGCTDTRKRVCTESWLREKNLLLHQGIEPVSAACRSDALPTELHPCPYSTSSISWIYRPLFFFFVGNFCLYTRGIIEIFAHLKKNNIGFFLNPIVASSFELCMIITSFGVYVHIFHAQFDNLDLVTRSQVCQKCKLEIACIRFLSSVVYMLFGCYIHLKDHAQYDLWDFGVYSGELLSRWPRGQATYIGHKNLVPPQNATI